MWVWLPEPGQAARVVHVVDRLGASPFAGLSVTTACGRAPDLVEFVYARRPGQSFDLCPICDPVISSRRKDAP